MLSVRLLVSLMSRGRNCRSERQRGVDGRTTRRGGAPARCATPYHMRGDRPAACKGRSGRLRRHSCWPLLVVIGVEGLGEVTIIYGCLPEASSDECLE